MKRIIIAIDGPAASGKSTAAKLLAQKLGYVYLDTGAMYRACALAAKRAGIDISDQTALAELLAKIEIKISFAPKGNVVILNGEDVSSAIREPDISRMASAISAQRLVREKMVDLQREMGRHGGVVLDGRDIGTVVFPDAGLKFFLVAPPEVRARRRYLELLQKGLKPLYIDVLNEMKERDEADSSRELAPLVPAADAIHIDSKDYGIEELTELLYRHFRKITEGL
jgi:CMP/dCMP kinase